MQASILNSGGTFEKLGRKVPHLTSPWRNKPINKQAAFGSGSVLVVVVVDFSTDILSSANLHESLFLFRVISSSVIIIHYLYHRLNEKCKKTVQSAKHEPYFIIWLIIFFFITSNKSPVFVRACVPARGWGGQASTFRMAWQTRKSRSQASLSASPFSSSLTSSRHLTGPDQPPSPRPPCTHHQSIRETKRERETRRSFTTTFNHLNLNFYACGASQKFNHFFNSIFLVK